MGSPRHFGGRSLERLLQVRKDFPITLHGVSLSIGSTDRLDQNYLNRLKRLIGIVDPLWVSDHLCWTGVGGENIHDLLPLPYTREAIRHVTDRICRVQDFLGRRLTIENVSSYVAFSHSRMTEWEFLNEICERADCDILLDVNNIFVSAVNHGFDPMEYLRAIPGKRVRQFHLAGHANKGHYRIDTHDRDVCEDVWRLYAEAVKLYGAVPVILERDGNIPPLKDLIQELNYARRIEKRSRPQIERSPALDEVDHRRSPRREKGPRRPTRETGLQG